MVAVEELEKQKPGFLDSTGANILNALINTAQFPINQAIVPLVNEGLARTSGIDRNSPQRDKILQLPYAHLQDAPNPLDKNFSKRANYIKDALLQGKSPEQAMTEADVILDEPLSIRESAEGKGELFQALTGGNVELGLINEIAKRAIGGAGFLAGKFPVVAGGFGTVAAADDLRRQQEEILQPQEAALPLSGKPLTRELIAKDEEERIYRAEKPIGIEGSPLFNKSYNPQRTSQAFLTGVGTVVGFEALGAAGKALAKTPLGKAVGEKISSVTGEVFKKNIEPVLQKVRANYSEYTQKQMQGLVDKTATKLDEIKGVKDVLSPKVVELAKQVEANNPIRQADLKRAVEIIQTVEDPKFKPTSNTSIVKKINEAAGKFMGGEEKAIGVEPIYQEAVDISKRLNNATEVFKQHRAIKAQDDFLTDIQTQLTRVGNVTDRVFKPTTEARNVSAKELETYLFDDDAKLALNNNIQDTLNLKFNKAGEIVPESSLYDAIPKKKVETYIQGKALDDLYAKQATEKSFEDEIKQYSQEPFQWFSDVMKGVKNVEGKFLDPAVGDGKNLFDETITTGKRWLTRSIFGTYDIMRHMDFAGDPVAKIWFPALSKARGQELNLKGRYWNTPLDEGGKSLEDLYEGLRVWKGTPQSRALDWVKRYTPFYKMISADGSIETANRANLSSFKDEVISSIEENLKKETRKIKDPKVLDEINALRTEGLTRVEEFFNPKLPDKILNSVERKGVLKIANNSVDEFRQIWDQMPDELQEAGEALYKQSFGGVRPASVEAQARYKAVLQGLEQSGKSKAELNLFETLLKEHAKLSDEEKYFLTSPYERFTPKHLNLLETETKMLRDRVAVDEKLAPEKILDAYSYQAVPKWLKEEKTRKSFEEILNTKDRKEIFQEIAGPYEFARSGNFYFERDARSAIERRLDLSARFQTLEPMVDLVKQTYKNPNASKFTQEVIEDFGKKILNLENFGAFKDVAAYQAFRQGFRNVAGQALGTVKFPLLNAGQIGLFYAENPELFGKVQKFLVTPETSQKLLKAMEKTGISKEVIKQENLNSFSSISQNFGGIPILNKDISKTIDKNIIEPYAKWYSRNPNPTTTKLIHALTTNPALAMSEQFLTMQFAVGGLMKHFKGNEKKVLALLNRVDKGDTQARGLFNELIVRNVNENGFTLNTEFSQSNVQATPVLREMATFTTFTLRGISKMAHWLRTGNTKALARYMTFLTTFTGPNSVLFFDKMQDSAKRLANAFGAKIDEDKAKNRGEATRLFEKGDYGVGPSKVFALGQSAIRQTGRQAQEAVFGTDITPGAQSQALDIDGLFPISYLQKLDSQLLQNPEAAGYYIGAGLTGRTPIVGIPEAGRIKKELVGNKQPGSVKTGTSPLVREEVEGIKFFDRFTQSYESFPKGLLNPDRLTKKSNVARVLNVSGFEERMGLRAGEVAKIRDLSRRFQEASRNTFLDELNTSARDEKVNLESRLNDAIKNYVGNAVQSGDFRSREAVEGDLIKRILKTEERGQTDYKSVSKAEALSKLRSLTDDEDKDLAREDYLEKILDERERTGNYDKVKKDIVDAYLLGEDDLGGEE